jgi:hypothetical protein
MYELRLISTTTMLETVLICNYSITDEDHAEISTQIPHINQDQHQNTHQSTPLALPR